MLVGAGIHLASGTFLPTPVRSCHEMVIDNQIFKEGSHGPSHHFLWGGSNAHRREHRKAHLNLRPIIDLFMCQELLDGQRAREVDLFGRHAL